MHPLLSALDVDQDGVISVSERENAGSALTKLDTNKDGSVTSDELRPRFGGPGGGPGGRPGGPGETRPPEASELVKTLMSFDANGDGQLQKGEVPERMQGLFARADSDNNSVLTPEELTKIAQSQAQTADSGRGEGRGPQGRGDGERRGFGGPGGPGGMRMDPVLAALDANGDGKVAGTEIEGASAALKALDKNGDGRITEDEVRPNFGGGRRPGEERR